MIDHQPSNTERTSTEEAIDRLRHQNELILNAAGEGIYGLDLDGKITFVNPAAARMIEWRVEDLIGKTMHDILHHSQPDGSPYPREECSIYAAFRDGTVYHVTDEVFWRKDGICFPVEYISTPIRDDQGEVIGAVVTFKDITEQRQAEEKLRVQAQLLDSVRESVVATDLEGDVVYWGKGAEALYGYRTDEVIGKPITFIVEFHEEDEERRRIDVVRTRGLWCGQYWQRRKDGSKFWADTVISLVTDEKGQPCGFIGIDRDITDRKRAEEALRRAHDMLELAVQERTTELSKAIGILEEQIDERHRAEEELRRSQEQLRALSARLLFVQEEERSRIAREIHDELGQALTALKIDLAWIGQRLAPKQDPLKRKAEEMAHLIDTTVRAVRRISTELRPRVLDHLGLVAALEWQMREFQDRTGIASAFTSNLKEINLDATRATTLFRVCQEALTNVTRHANATRVKLNLKKVGRDLVLEVRDNGRGITKEAIADPKALGLIGMRERVLPWGGDVDIKGFREKGTTISVRIPVGEGKADVSGDIA